MKQLNHDVSDFKINIKDIKATWHNFKPYSSHQAMFLFLWLSVCVQWLVMNCREAFENQWNVYEGVFLIISLKSSILDDSLGSEYAPEWH